MVNAKELRKGNLVAYADTHVVVNDIGDAGINIQWYHELTDYEYKFEQLNPIILSSELLIQCGLIRGTNDEFFISRFNLRPVEDKWEVYIQGNDTRFHWLLDLHFLHDLQNLIYQFLRKELTLKQY